MRFLHTIPSADPALGGPIEAMNRLGAALERRGHVTEIVSTDAPAAPWLAESALKIHALGPAKGASLGTGIRRYSYAPNLRPWLREHGGEYDAVIVHGLWQYLSFASWSALHGGGVPYVVYPHGMLDPWFKRRYPAKHLKKWLYWPWADYRLLRDAKCVIFTSDEERVLARESFWLYRAEEAVVRYGTADPQPVDPGARKRFLETYPMLNGKEVILYLSRITRKKGCDLVIRAFGEAFVTNPE
nr:glycosyltransferase [Gemmatimonadaceae bacterium]